jgi:hypothetical protein
MTAWAGLGSALVGGLTSMWGGNRRNEMQIEQAREQMAFQERMSNTAYQRATKDLEKAGLNRIMAFGSPSTTPAGAQAQIQDVATPAVNTALASRRLAQEIKNMKETENLTREQSYTQKMQRSLMRANTEKTLYEANSAETLSKILLRDKELADIDKGLYEKAPILRIIEKVLGTAGTAKKVIN